MARIINADDFGMSKEINEGILMAFKSKAIDSVSIICGRETKEAISLAKEHKIPCGVHLHRKGPVYFIFLKSFFSGNFKKQLEREFEKQIIELKEKIKIEHINSHQHIHMFPPIFNIVAKLAKKHNLRLRLSKNIEISLFNRLGLKLFYPINRKTALRNGIIIMDSYETNHKNLKKLIQKTKYGEIIVHPGIKNGKNFSGDKCITRKKELNILLKK
jgi:predicted glycoside hydrolase/deacetylase ChbG (UPF0249 family)